MCTNHSKNVIEDRYLKYRDQYVNEVNVKSIESFKAYFHFDDDEANEIIEKFNIEFE